MADYDWTKPTPGGSSGTWGAELNAILDVIQAHPGIKVLADATALAAYVPLLGQVVLQADTATLYKCTNASGPVWAEVGPAAAADSVLTTKGDLLVYGAALSRLGVGSNGQVLTADAAQELGVKWATPSGGGGGGFPFGSIFYMVSSGAPPDGALLCNGQLISKVTYADLFALIGITYNDLFSIVPEFGSSNSYPPWIASASTEASTNEGAWAALISTVNTRWRASTSTGWFKIENTADSFTVSAYKITGNYESNYVGRSPKSWVLKDANGNIVDTRMDEPVWVKNEERTYKLATPVTTTSLLWENITCRQDYVVFGKLELCFPLDLGADFALPNLPVLDTNLQAYIQIL